MPASEASRHRPYHVAAFGLLAFVAGVILRLGAHPWCTHLYHVSYTPGTDLNGVYTNEPLFNACVEIARVLLGLGAALLTTAAAARLFVPTPHLPTPTNFSEPGFTPSAPTHPPSSPIT